MNDKERNENEYTHNNSTHFHHITPAFEFGIPFLSLFLCHILNMILNDITFVIQDIYTWDKTHAKTITNGYEKKNKNMTHTSNSYMSCRRSRSSLFAP